MQKAYVIGQISIQNSENYEEYARKVVSTVTRFGGKYIVRGGSSVQLEGESFGDRNVIIEFPSNKRALDWYRSEDYNLIKHLRCDNTVGHLRLVEGI